MSGGNRMSESTPISLDNGIYLIDLYDLGWPKRTGSYAILDEHPTIIETGPSPSIHYLLDGLKQIGIEREDLQYVIVTHIHLDHAGGAGLLLRECPNAKIIVHPKGASHLINPEKLIRGARAVYGDQFDDLFHPILPVPEEQLLIMKDRETLRIGPNRVLQFFDSPGHANHHLGIFDPLSRGVFTGDTAGIQYPQTVDCGVPLYLPTTSPNQFNPEAMKQSIENIRRLNPDKIYFGHFGATTDIGCLDMVETWLDTFVEIGRKCWEQGLGISTLSEELLVHIEDSLSQWNVRADHPVFEVLRLDMTVCAMGILDYFQRSSPSTNKG
jgi:glyoxylase-like metal-dependent hydrolase (beta-lactamase superfamily II)